MVVTLAKIKLQPPRTTSNKKHVLDVQTIGNWLIAEIIPIPVLS